MESLPYDVIHRITDMVGCEVFPDEFYMLRIVSKSFRDNIDLFNCGFYKSLKYNFEIKNGEYESYIQNIEKPISLEFGRKILGLDDWTIHYDDYKFITLKYPKYIRNHYNQWIYSLTPSQEITNQKTDTDYGIEEYIFEKYYNKMKELHTKFKHIDNKIVIKWLKQNGE